LEGTQHGEWAGIEPSGKKMEVPAALILFDGDGLIRERAYFDQATVVRQLAPTAD
jgi:predicted ester cyclase